MPKNPHADFSPVLDGYSGIGAFRFWCQTALPLTYDDSLSYYELLNKVVTYLNHTIEDLTAVESNTSALAEAYNQLQKYVNDYFDDLDVEAELRNVLDAMAEDGTLDAILDPLVENHLPGIVDEKIDGVVAEQIDGAVAGQIDESVGEQLPALVDPLVEDLLPDVVDEKIDSVVAEQIDGSVAGQIDESVAEQLPALVDEGIPGEVTDWLTENVDPVGSAVMVDSSLTISGAAADAKVTGDIKTQFNDYRNVIKIPSLSVKQNNLTNGKTRTDAQSGVTLTKTLDGGLKVNGTVDVSSANKTIYFTNNIPLESGKTYTVYIDTSMNYAVPNHGAIYLNGVYHNGVANMSIAQNTLYKLTPSQNTNMTVRYYMPANATIGNVVFTDTIFMLYVVEGNSYTLKDFDRLKAIEIDLTAAENDITTIEGDVGNLETSVADQISKASVYANSSYDVRNNNLAVGKMRPGQDATGVTITKFTEYGVTLNGTVDISASAKTIYMVSNIPLTSGKTYTIFVDSKQSKNAPDRGTIMLSGAYNGGTPNVGIAKDTVVRITPSQNTNMQINYYMTQNTQDGTVVFDGAVLVFYVVEGNQYTLTDFRAIDSLEANIDKLTSDDTGIISNIPIYKQTSYGIENNNLVKNKVREGTDATGVVITKINDYAVKLNGTVDAENANKTVYIVTNIPLTSGHTYTVYVDDKFSKNPATGGVIALNGAQSGGVANVLIPTNTIQTITPSQDTNMQINYYAPTGSVVTFDDTILVFYTVEGNDYNIDDFRLLDGVQADINDLKSRVTQNETDIDNLETEDTNLFEYASIYSKSSNRVKTNNLIPGKIRTGANPTAGITISKFTNYGAKINGNVDVSSAYKTVYISYNIALTSGHVYTFYVDTTNSANKPEAGAVYLNGARVGATTNLSVKTDTVVTFTPSQDTNVQIVWYMPANAEIGTVHFNDAKFIFYLVEGYDYSKEDFVGKSEADAFNPYDYEEKSIYSSLVTGLPIFELSGNTAGMTKDNAVTLNWKYKGDSGTATVKWQGASSLNYPKKNYSIKLDHNINVGWGDQKKYVLKGEFIDNSHALNIGSAKLWGAIVANRNTNPAIGNSPNNGAMTGFPVMVMLNGKFHGLFMFNTPKDKWTFGMGSSTSEYIVTAEAHSAATQFKALAELDGTDFELEYKDDSVAESAVKTSLNTMIQAVLDAGQNWEETVAPYLDIDSAIDYYIFSALIDNDDGTDKNFILTTYNGTKWWFNAYDMDSVMGNHWTGGYYRSPYSSITNLNRLATTSRLFSLIYSYSKAKLVARYNYLRQNILSDGYVATNYYNHVVRIPEEVYHQDTKVWTMLPGTWTNNVARISDFYRMRSVYIDREVKAIEESLT